MLFCNSFTGRIETEHGYSEHGNLGNALLEEGKIDEAILHYKEALKLAPDYSEANINLANALSKKGEIGQAIIHYKKALQHKTDCHRPVTIPWLSSTEPLATKSMAIWRTLWSNRGKIMKRSSITLHHCELKPDQPEVHYNLANILMGQGKLNEAVAHYNEALKLKPDYLEARSNMAKALAKQGKLLEAIQQWQQLVRLILRSGCCMVIWEWHISLLGQLDKAIMHWEEALRLKPDHVNVINKLAWLLATCEDPNYRVAARAVELAERGCKLTAYKDPRLLDTLAAAYAEAGRFDEAD